MGLINMPHALWEALLGDLNKQAEDPGGGIAKRALENQLKQLNLSSEINQKATVQKHQDKKAKQTKPNK